MYVCGYIYVYTMPPFLTNFLFYTMSPVSIHYFTSCCTTLKAELHFLPLSSIAHRTYANLILISLVGVSKSGYFISYIQIWARFHFLCWHLWFFSVYIFMSFFCSEETLAFLCPLPIFITFPPILLPLPLFRFVLLIVFISLLYDPYYILVKAIFPWASWNLIFNFWDYFVFFFHFLHLVNSHFTSYFFSVSSLIYFELII